MRNLANLIKQIKEIVPSDYHDEHNDLNWQIEHLSYQAPELEHSNFFRFADEWIEPAIGEPPIVENWKLRVLALWIDKPFEEINKLYGKN